MKTVKGFLLLTFIGFAYAPQMAFSTVEPFTISGSTCVYRFSPVMLNILSPEQVTTDGLITASSRIRPQRMLQTSPIEMFGAGIINIMVKFEASWDMSIPVTLLAKGIPLAEIEVTYTVLGSNLYKTKMLRSSDVSKTSVLAEFTSKKRGPLIYACGNSDGEKQLVLEPIHVEDSVSEVIVSVGQIWSDTQLKFNEIQISFTKDSDD